MTLTVQQQQHHHSQQLHVSLRNAPATSKERDKDAEMASHTDDETALTSKTPGLDDLFFDMLFAAALSVYGNNVDLSQLPKVLIFASYFSLLWWAWWSQSLFDVRYRGREAMGLRMQCAQRIVRCIMMGVWVAFATVVSDYSRGAYVTFAKVFIWSRGVLIADYLLIIAYQWNDSKFTTATEEKSKSRSSLSPFTSHIIIIAGTLISMIFWIVSLQYGKGDGNTMITSTTAELWCCAIIIELVAEVAVEINGSQKPLHETPLVERLALFSLIIFGNGFENIGQALNNISPGSQDWQRGGMPSGGWSHCTIINAAASVLIVTLLFFTYFVRAIRELISHPSRVLIWCYLHLVLHVSAAVLVIGLGKAISFINTLNALLRLSDHPSLYLPNTTDWQDWMRLRMPTTTSEAIVPNVQNITNPFDRQYFSVIIATIALQGAQIPNIELSSAIVNSTFPFKGMDIPPAVSTQLNLYSNLIDAVHSPDTVADFVEKNVFQFYYAYLCPALFFVADSALKVVQRSANEEKSMDRQFVGSIALRLFFAVVLILMQVAYYFAGSVSTGFALYALVYMAIILALEALLQFFFTSHELSLRIFDYRRRQRL